jgi:hypothetical protein
VHRDLDDVVEELVEPGAAEDPELDGVHGRRRQEAAAVPGVDVFVELDDSDEDVDEDDDVESLFEDESLFEESLDDEAVVEDFFEPERLSVL